MTRLERFLFDTDFEIADPAADAGAAEAEAAEEEEDAEAEQPQPEYFEEDVTRAREEGHTSGHAEGYAEGLEAGKQDEQAKAEHAAAEALNRVGEQMAQLVGGLGAAEERRDRETLTVAVRLVSKLYPALHRRHGLKEIEAVLSDCLNRLRENPRVVVRVAPARAEVLQGRIEALSAKAGYEGKVLVVSDEDLPDGDVRVEWSEGGAERDQQRVWREVEEALTRAVEGDRAARTNGSGEAGEQAAATGTGGEPSGDEAGAAG